MDVRVLHALRRRLGAPSWPHAIASAVSERILLHLKMFMNHYLFYNRGGLSLELLKIEQATCCICSLTCYVLPRWNKNASARVIIDDFMKLLAGGLGML